LSPPIVQPEPPSAIASAATGLWFACWAVLALTAVVRILVLAGCLYVHRWSRCGARGLRLGRLRTHVLRAAVAASVLDRDGIRLLPDRIEVLLTPADLRTLGPVADWLCVEIAHDVSTVARDRGYRLLAGPRVEFRAFPDGRPGRPSVRTLFGNAQDDPPMTQPGRPVVRSGTGSRGAVLRRLEPSGRPLLLGDRHHARIGRTDQSDLLVASPSVSRYHASIYLQAGEWFVVDHGSTNGTLVNAMRVEFPVRLADGDELRLGREVRIRFELNHLRVM
jgi:FHA domain/Protein of unknown function (DUF3662)